MLSEEDSWQLQRVSMCDVRACASVWLLHFLQPQPRPAASLAVAGLAASNALSALHETTAFPSRFMPLGRDRRNNSGQNARKEHGANRHGGTPYLRAGHFLLLPLRLSRDYPLTPRAGMIVTYASVSSYARTGMSAELCAQRPRRPRGFNYSDGR